jgi:competence protein ComEC
VDVGLVLGIALAGGALLASQPLAAGGAFVALAWLARLHRRPALLVVAAALLATAAWRARSAVAKDEARREADALAGAMLDCEGDATVLGSPALLGDALRAHAHVAGSCAGRPWSGVVAMGGVPAETARGDRLAIRGRFGPVHRFHDVGDPAPSLARHGVLRSGRVSESVLLARGRGPPAWIDRARAHVRARILATFPASTQALARALVLGEGDIAGGDEEAFRDSGLSHLLAVSGMHLVLVVGGLVAACRAVLVRIPAVASRADPDRWAALAGVPAAWLYADFAGGSGSAIRASYMLFAALLARALGRRSDATRALGLSIAAMALLDPLVAFDLSFVLSAAATAGLVFVARPLDGALAARLPGWALWATRPACTTIAATVACAPVLALMSPTLPMAGVVANAIAVPLGELAALPLCLAHALASPAGPVERGLALAGSGALELVRLVARGFAGATWAQVPVPRPTPAELAALAVLAAAVAARRPRAAFVAAAVVVACEAWTRYEARPRGRLIVDFLDVGQGDAALVSLPDGTAILVDGGGLVGSPLDVGRRVVAPALRARRRDRLRAVVVSHPHPDHFGGLPSALNGVRVDAIWDTAQGESEGTGGAYAELLSDARRRGVPVLGPSALCGAHDMGGAVVEVLAPCPVASPDRGPNDNSFVIRVRHGARAVLFVGDAEREEEDLLLGVPGAPARLRADVLKVGHHGSRTSSQPAFVGAVGPAHAVVSVGARNTFGHPDVQTLDTLAAFGASVWRTDRHGTVTMDTDGASLTVRSRLSPKPPGPRLEWRP